MTEKEKGVVVSGSSVVAIEKDGKSYVQPFTAGSHSTDIVNASLTKQKLSGVTPQYVQNQIINNINTVEKYVNDNPTVETEHSFELNLKIFKYRYTRKITESE